MLLLASIGYLAVRPLLALFRITGRLVSALVLLVALSLQGVR